jgi:hypothetical protein
VGELNNQGMLLIIKLSEAVSFMARMQRVIATRLQAQHSPFRLCTSSNTSSVPTNVTHESFR